MLPLVGTLVTAKLLAIGAAVSAVAIAAASVVAYNNGAASDKQRSDLVISKMVIDADKNLSDANKLIKAQSDLLQATKEGAEHALQTERDANQRLRDANVASAGAAERLRQRLAGAAGGVGVGDDSLAACRERTTTFAVVLGAALQAHALCTGDLEDTAGSVRALRSAWPTLRSVK